MLEDGAICSCVTSQDTNFSKSPFYISRLDLVIEDSQSCAEMTLIITDFKTL